jgi:hypothetical protein
MLLLQQFAILSLKEEILTKHLSREELEAVVDKIGAEVRC